MPGRWPDAADDPIRGEAITQLVCDAEELLDELEASNRLEARAVFGFYPVNSHGDDIIVYADEDRRTELGRVHTLRQQMTRPRGRANLALADFVAGPGIEDWMGFFAVTAGIGLESMVDEAKADHDDYRAIMLKAVADRLAEAFAERLHERVRTQYWGYVGDEALTNEALINEEYQGIRPAPGYPACPDHMEKEFIARLLGMEDRIGMSLTESFAISPAASVSGYYFARPEARYFGLGRIGLDQVQTYAERKGFELAEMERWLSPSLGYSPKK